MSSTEIYQPPAERGEAPLKTRFRAIIQAPDFKWLFSVQDGSRRAQRAAQQISVERILESAPIETEARKASPFVSGGRAPACQRETNQRQRRCGSRLQGLQCRDELLLNL